MLGGVRPPLTFNSDRGAGLMQGAGTGLPMSIAELEGTCLPLARATMLPGAAFTDPGVFAWELAHVFQGGWVFAAHASRLAGPGATGRGARRRPRPAARALPSLGPAARRAHRLRRGRQLEGDRRELQRVPALPRRAPRAEPPQPLPLRRGGRRRGGLVRRLDD